MDDIPEANARNDAPKPGDPTGAQEEIAGREGDRRSAFVCHCSEADGSEANALVRKLEALGISCWIAPRDLRGRTINKASVAGVKNCPFTIVLISEQALATTKFMVHEIHIAHSHEKKIIPVIRGTVAGNDLDEYSFYFANEAYVEVASFTDDDCVAELAKRIPHKEPLPPSTTVPPPADTRASSPPSPRGPALRLRTPLIVAAAVVIGFFVTLPFLRPKDLTDSKSSDDGGKTASATGSHEATPADHAAPSPSPDEATVAPAVLLAGLENTNASEPVDATVTIQWPGVPEGWRVEAHATPIASAAAASDESTPNPIDGVAGGWTFTFRVAPDPAPTKVSLTLIASPLPADSAHASGAVLPVQVTRQVTVVHAPSFRARDWAKPKFDRHAAPDAAATFTAATRIDEWFGRLPQSVAEATAAFSVPSEAVVQLTNAIAEDARAEIDAAHAWIEAVKASRLRLATAAIAYNAKSTPSIVRATLQPGMDAATLEPFFPADLFSLVPEAPGLRTITSAKASATASEVDFQIPIPANDGSTTYTLKRCDGVVMTDGGLLTVKRVSKLPQIAFAPDGRPAETLVIDRTIPDSCSVTVTFTLDEPGTLVVRRSLPSTAGDKTPFVDSVVAADVSKPVTVVVPLPGPEAFEAAGSARLEVEISASVAAAAGITTPEPLRASFVALDAAAFGERAASEIDRVVDNASLVKWNQRWNADLFRMPEAIQASIRKQIKRNDYVERRDLGLLLFGRSSKSPLEFEKKQARFWNLNLPSSSTAAKSIEFVELQGGPTTLEADPKLAKPTRTYFRNVPRFLIATRETTVGELDLFLATTAGAPHRRTRAITPNGDSDLPAVGIPYETARAFAVWLETECPGPGIPGYGFALPNEFEWRHACAELAAELASDPARTRESAAVFGGLHAPKPVGSCAANAFGIHDLLGNAAEWCEDTLVEQLQIGSLLRDYGRPTYPVLRGGSYLVDDSQAEAQLNCWHRGWSEVGEEADVGAGFRVVFRPLAKNP